MALLPRALVAVLAALLSGCLAHAPAQPGLDEAASSPDDGMHVTATRVEPYPHPVDVAGAFALKPCLADGAQCELGLAGTWDTLQMDFGDPAALFWRVALQADWAGVNTVTALRLDVYATTPCGIACLGERFVVSAYGDRETAAQAPTPAVLHEDVFLKGNETGLRVRLSVAGGQPGPAAAQVDYRLAGSVVGYRPDGTPPVVLA